MNSKSAADRWLLTENGIRWDIRNDNQLPHQDKVEMSGFQASAIIQYGVDDSGVLLLRRTVVWPNLRTIPNNTHASLTHAYPTAATPLLLVNGLTITEERPQKIAFDGILRIESIAEAGIVIRRQLFPAVDAPALLETVEVENASGSPVLLEMESSDYEARGRGISGIYAMEARLDSTTSARIQPGETARFTIVYAGRVWRQPSQKLDGTSEEKRRSDKISMLRNRLRLHTPDPVLNQMFAFAKLRAAESIFRTKEGLLHSPGGGSYYAAVWTNDQIEYAAPFFPFLGDPAALEATSNAFQLYVPFMGPDLVPIPSSIIAEGQDIWEGVGDRGDAAMYAYGAARYALACGDRSIAGQLWPAIEWSLSYCQAKLTAQGVVASDSDELEGRFPAGSANLSTSSLAYDAFRHAAIVAKELGQVDLATAYEEAAIQLRQALENYFGAEVEGFETYRYYDGNDILRSWISLPLCMGILDRKQGTVSAMLSPRLWTEDGLATEAGDHVFWDRSTLYGFRALFIAGETEKALARLSAYSRRRLLGDHVPYAVEAYPEGDQRHLSAESTLYGRIITEGLFGIRFTGLASFACTPRLPAEWPSMSLSAAQICGRELDLIVERAEGNGMRLIVQENDRETVFIGHDGSTFDVSLNE
ncbi:hypothetical protein [Cohnella soli]|uniref:Uncharacterized protein n=1 Tax=Cohnella soli TaxID=425005 RepID=A0ABW0I0L6_9BACL